MGGCKFSDRSWPGLNFPVLVTIFIIHFLHVRSVSQDDFPQLRQPFHPDDVRGAPLQRNSIFRPSGKSIYSTFGCSNTTDLISCLWNTWLWSFIVSGQRKEYSETLNKQSDSIHVRVEVSLYESARRHAHYNQQYQLWALLLHEPPQHLFTCDLDGRELKTLDDCMAKLKRLDAKGRLWPQEMIMEVHGGYLLLCDIETKVGYYMPQEFKKMDNTAPRWHFGKSHPTRLGCEDPPSR